MLINLFSRFSYLSTILSLAKRLFLAGMCLLVSLSADATVLFQDNFNSGAASPEWVSKMCCQWVQDGWYYTKSVENNPTDSLAIVHDKDKSWKDYKLSMKAQFNTSSAVGHYNVLLRTNDFVRINGPQQGTAYQLEFFGSNWDSPHRNRIVLSRCDLDIGSVITLVDKSFPLPVNGSPLNLEIVVQGAKISLSINGQSVFSVVDPNPLPYGGIGVHTIWSEEARFDDVVLSTLDTTIPLLSLNDINKDGAPEIAIVTYNPTLKKSTATVKNAQNGGLVKQIAFNGQFVPTKANILPDLNGNGAPEIAVLGVRSSDQAVQVEVRDSLSGVKLSAVPFDSIFTPLDLGVVRDISGKGTAGLAVLQQSDTELRVQLKNVLSGVQIGNISFSAGYKGIDLLVLGDLNGNRTKEIAVLADNKTITAADTVEIRDSKTGELIRTISYGTGKDLQQLINLPDLNHSGGAELVVLRANTARVLVKDAKTGLAVNTLDYAVSQPFRLATVADSNRQTNLAMLGVRAVTGQPRADVHDPLSDTFINKVLFDNYGTTVGFISIPDTNGNGIAELVRLREQPGPQKLFAEIRDGRTGELLQGMYF